jgi:hypothetical protein
MGAIKELVFVSIISMMMCISLSILKLNVECRPSRGFQFEMPNDKKIAPEKKGFQMWWNKGKLKIKFK